MKLIVYNRTHWHSAFSKYVIIEIIDKCGYESILYLCRTCGRAYLLLSKKILPLLFTNCNT